MYTHISCQKEMSNYIFMYGHWESKLKKHSVNNPFTIDLEARRIFINLPTT